MSLLYPIGLFALAGLLIPLIIHLWNVKQGKTLKIGSIALLGVGAPLSSRSYRIKDWLLLLLRLLLITLLGFLLAGPYFMKKAVARNEKGWVLIEKSTLIPVYETHKKEIDSLLNSGYQLHDFNIGFSEIDINDILKKDLTTNRNTVGYHSMLKQLNERLPARFPVYLFADRRLGKLTDELPLIDFNLQWKDTGKRDTISSWTTSLSGKNYEAISSPALTRYRSLDAGKDRPTIVVLLFKSANEKDADYVTAALNAITDFTKRKVEIKYWNSQFNSDLKFDVGFWLSDEPIAAGFLKHLKPEGRLFSYERGKTISFHSEMNLLPGKTGKIPGLILHKRIAAPAYVGENIWNDGFGRPVLTLEKEKRIDHYRFYSRLSPQWSTLVWNELFVKALMPIVLGRNGDNFAFESHPDDQRSSPDLFSGKPASGKPLLKQMGGQPQPLHQYFWILALSVFILERMLSFNHKTRVNHG